MPGETPPRETETERKEPWQTGEGKAGAGAKGGLDPESRRSRESQVPGRGPRGAGGGGQGQVEGKESAETEHVGVETRVRQLPVSQDPTSLPAEPVVGAVTVTDVH